ncbi:MAG: CpaF family protein [Lachnospiraceae bacterium]|nr:CpaF family protein [Lachnospiraceae bacterium]
MEDNKALVEELRRQVIGTVDMSEEIQDDVLHEVIDSVIDKKKMEMPLSVYERISIHKQIFDSMRGLGIITELLSDDEITEIMVNSAEDIFVERCGLIEKVDGCFFSGEQLEDVIQQIAAMANKRVNQTNPIVDTRLSDGSRVNIVLNPISIEGSAVTIRKFPKESITMEKLILLGSITKEAADFLQSLVKAGYNIIISGGTGTGKTTFLNALSDYIPSNERIITIEDSAELRLHNVENIIRMEVRQQNVEGKNGISIRDLIRTSLRMRPDRIIVGEVRGGEAIDMLQAMNTGHEGSLSTGHANSARDMLSRLAVMCLMGADIPMSAIMGQISSAVDIVVHLGRFRDGSRGVVEICEVGEIKHGEIETNSIFVREKGVGGSLSFTGNKLVNRKKLERI